MRIFSYLLSACLIALFGTSNPLRAEDKVIVHEWGTFTCLQDENGKAIGGINVDDEPVPSFVFQEGGGQEVAAQYSHDLGNFGLPPYLAGKGWASGDPAVTMRLETPVIYIYPPKGQSPSSVPPLDVHVDFHGGMLTQFYPYADAVPFNGQANISEQLMSSLDWNGVKIGSKEKPVETDDKVWTTPREVSAPVLQVMMHWRGGNAQPDPVGVPQAEHFLFYRGVGHLDSPLRMQDGDGEVGVWPQKSSGSLEYTGGWWLAEIHADGSCAFREPHLTEPQGQNGLRPVPMVTFSEKFAVSDFSADNLTKLKSSMHDALVKDGLYDDEATAMLKTWELSYFKSPGLRFFYIVPRAWVDKILPLKITGAPIDITRVMVGRIELITDAQKSALVRLASGPCPDLVSVKKAAQDALQNSKLPKDEVDAFYHGEKPLSELGITIPPLVQDYLNLGRFRDALIVHEQQLHPSAVLAQFIKDNRLASGN